MQDIKDDIVINAPTEEVWLAIEDPKAHAAWHPFVTHITGEHSLGRSRACDVLVGKKPGKTAERCSRYESGQAIFWTIEQDTSGFSRMVSDWSAGFSLEAQGPSATRVIAESIFAPATFFARLTAPMIRRKFHQTQRSILASLKRYVEK